MKEATFGQALQVLKLVNDQRVNSQKLTALFESGLLSDLLNADVSKINRNDFRESIDLPLAGYRFFVDYKEPLDKLIKSAKFKSADERINSETIPSIKIVDCIGRTVTAEIHNFSYKGVMKYNGNDSSRTGCLQNLADRGVRGATLEELVAFHKKYPLESKNKRIFAPGSPVDLPSGTTWYNDGASGSYNLMACLEHEYLDLQCETGWSQGYYVLGIIE